MLLQSDEAFSWMHLHSSNDHRRMPVKKKKIVTQLLHQFSITKVIGEESCLYESWTALKKQLMDLNFWAIQMIVEWLIGICKVLDISFFCYIIYTKNNIIEQKKT